MAAFSIATIVNANNQTIEKLLAVCYEAISDTIGPISFKENLAIKSSLTSKAKIALHAFNK